MRILKGVAGGWPTSHFTSRTWVPHISLLRCGIPWFQARFEGHLVGRLFVMPSRTTLSPLCLRNR
jgi:hypothetical protein